MSSEEHQEKWQEPVKFLGGCWGFLDQQLLKGAFLAWHEAFVSDSLFASGTAIV